MRRFPGTFFTMERCKQLIVGGFFLAWIAYFAWFWGHALFFDAGGNFWVGLVNLWGDWAAHFTMATALQMRGIGISSPFLAGAQFSYPFVANLISAWLMRAGVPLITAFVVPSFVCSVAVVTALFYFFQTVFRSRGLAIVAALIFLLNGGIGFYYFARDVAMAPEPLQMLVNPPHEYTRLDEEHIKYISVIDSMILPQRAFTLGFPVALVAATWVWQYFFQDKKSRRKLVAASLLIGVLPILHTHSFMAMFFVLATWCAASVWQKRRTVLVDWALLLGIVTVIALPLLYAFVFQHVGGAQFFHWYPGWLAREFKMSWLLFWWKNWGITPWVTGASAAWLAWRRRWSLIIWVTPFLVLFALVNLFLFQPFSWDNTKILAWVAVGVAGVSAYGLRILSRSRQMGARALAIVIFLFMIASGAIDAYWDLRTDLHSYQEYSAMDLQLADWAKANTPVDSIWLTSDQHNHWLYNLTGRQTLMAFTGWLWSQGYEYLPMNQDVTEMLTGGPRALQLLRKHDVTYVVMGESERRTMGANEAFFAAHFPIVKELGTTRIYQVTDTAP